MHIVCLLRANSARSYNLLGILINKATVTKVESKYLPHNGFE